MSSTVRPEPALATTRCPTHETARSKRQIVALAVSPSRGLLAMILVGVARPRLPGRGRRDAVGCTASTASRYVLIAVFVASTVSSIAGFAFSALCGALLFHLIDSPVYAVNVMIVCSASRSRCSASPRSGARSTGAASACSWSAAFSACRPASICCCICRPSTYRGVIGGMLMAYGSYLLLRWPVRIAAERAGRGCMRGISRRHHRRACRLSRRLRHHLVRPQGLGQDAPARRLSAVHPRHAAGHADRDLSDAASRRAGAAQLDWKAFCLRSGRAARRLVRPAHLQAPVGSAVRTRGQRAARSCPASASCSDGRIAIVSSKRR